MTGNRRSIRLNNHDYAKAGAYYVTVCVDGNACRGGSRTAPNVLGNIKNGKMILNSIGQIVKDSWQWLKIQYEYIDLDESIVMPNHLHGIICINNIRMKNSPVVQGGSRTAPTENRKTLGRLIGAFKTVSTKQINAIRNTPGVRFWQRNYYEHIIRGESDLMRIREYIVNNPVKWEEDEYYVK